jgi:hypothetical protein
MRLMDMLSLGEEILFPEPQCVVCGAQDLFHRGEVELDCHLQFIQKKIMGRGHEPTQCSWWYIVIAKS